MTLTFIEQKKSEIIQLFIFNKIIMVNFYYDMNKTSMANYNVSTCTILFNHV